MTGTKTKDCINLRGLKFYGYHGCLPEERSLGQFFSVDLTLNLDLRRAGQSDNLCDTVNYAEAVTVVQQIVAGEPHKLLESVAEQIAAELLQKFPPLESLTVTVHKPTAPLQVEFADASVSVTRERI